ncbi:MAG: hypothetical protein AAGC95_09780 [Pseudomonadota bacterium]
MAGAFALTGCETAQNLAPGGLFRPSTVPAEPTNPDMARRIEEFEKNARKERGGRFFQFPSLADMPSEAPEVIPPAERQAQTEALTGAGAFLNAVAADDARRAAADRAEDMPKSPPVTTAVSEAVEVPDDGAYEK